MSVVPKEDNLVMSFQEATRVFNHNQSNTGSRNDSDQLSNGNNNYREEDLNEENEAVPSRLYYKPDKNVKNSSNSRIASNDNVTSKYHNDKTDEYVKTQRQQKESTLNKKGTASVLPVTSPSQEEIKQNPNKKVEIRNPSDQTIRDSNFNDDKVMGTRETDRDLFRPVDESGEEYDEYVCKYLSKEKSTIGKDNFLLIFLLMLRCRYELLVFF